jgi:hypothetical protein
MRETDLFQPPANLVQRVDLPAQQMERTQADNVGSLANVYMSSVIASLGFFCYTLATIGSMVEAAVQPIPVA